MNRNELKKSKGHVAFLGQFEFFTDTAGNLWKAYISYPVQSDGTRTGRWEAPPHLADSMMRQYREAFSR